jgi:hypothetical protein
MRLSGKQFSAQKLTLNPLYRPFFRNDSSSSERSHKSNGKEYNVMKPVLIDDALGSRTYAVEVENAGGLL